MLVLKEDEAQRLKMGLFNVFCIFNFLFDAEKLMYRLDCNYDKPSMYLGMFKALWCVN